MIAVCIAIAFFEGMLKSKGLGYLLLSIVYLTGFIFLNQQIKRHELETANRVYYNLYHQ